MHILYVVLWWLAVGLPMVGMGLWLMYFILSAVFHTLVFVGRLFTEWGK